MKIDTTYMSTHVIVDRKFRIDLIENTIGWGHEIATVKDHQNQNAFATLTTTGVMIITNEDGMIITTWIANVRQAAAVWRQANNNKPMPAWLWRIVNYNNNTEAWHRMAA